MKKLFGKYSFYRSPFMKFEGEGDDDGGGGGGTEYIVGADGKFVENWKDHLPEEYRGEESLNLVADFPSLVKQHLNAQKMLGKDKVVLPGPNATPEEKAEFFTKIGRPKTAGDYKVEIPKELEKLYPADALQKAKERAFLLGATQEQFEGFMRGDMESAAALLKDTDAQQQTQWEADEKEIRKRFGTEDARLEAVGHANRLLAAIGEKDLELKQRLLQKYMHDPDFIEYSAMAARRMIPAGALDGTITHTTPKENKVKMDELRATPGYMPGNPLPDGSYLKDSDPKKHKWITEEISRLVQETYPEARQQASRV